MDKLLKNYNDNYNDNHSREKAWCKESHFYSLPFGQAEANIY